jgi:hypothetical protein
LFPESNLRERKKERNTQTIDWMMMMMMMMMMVVVVVVKLAVF